LPFGNFWTFFRKRCPYQWEAQIRRRGYPAQSKTFETKAEAEAWTKMIDSEMSRGVWVSRSEAETTTLYEALTRYEEEIAPAKKGAAQKTSVLKTCKAVDLAKRPLAAIRSADVAKLRNEWLKDYKPAKVLRLLAVLSHVFNSPARNGAWKAYQIRLNWCASRSPAMRARGALLPRMLPHLEVTIPSLIVARKTANLSE
jgi:dsDNA-binding SOS-regulon protein